jgi:transcriptional regulator with XRE-family HTH domain
MNPFLEKIGMQLREARKAKGWNQTQMAQMAGLSRREISEIENGHFRGSILKVQDYAMSLGYSLSLELKRRPTLNELGALFSED